MVRFTDDANGFWLEQSLDKGEMPKRGEPTFFGAPYRPAKPASLLASIHEAAAFATVPMVITFSDGTTFQIGGVKEKRYFGLKYTPPTQ